MPEDTEITKKTRWLNYSFGVDDKFREIDGGLLITNVPLLAVGQWTDSAVQTPLYYPEATLKEYASNWLSNGVWTRHSGRGAHRSVTEKVGEVRNAHYENGAVRGDVFLHYLTEASRDAGALVKSGYINMVSVEHGGEEEYNPQTKQYDAKSLSFYGLALVDKGACESCRIRSKSEPTDEVIDMTPEENAKALADLEAKLKSEHDAKIAELSKAHEEAIKAKTDELAKLSASIEEMNKKLEELSKSISEKDKSLSEASEKIKELSKLPAQPKTLEPKNEPVKVSEVPSVRIRKGSIEVPGF